MQLAGRICILAALVALGACAAPGPKPQRPAARSTPPATARRPSRAAAPARHVPPGKLTVGVLDPDDYQAGQARRIHALLGTPGVALGKNDSGYYMEVQEAKLRQLTVGSHAHIASRGESIFITPEGGAFASDGARLGAGIRAFLATVAPVLEEFDQTLITVHGYTDSTGPAAYNRKLSERRALAVARYLIQAGVDAARIVVVGHGDADPIASNATAKGRARNRRVVIELQPITP